MKRGFLLNESEKRRIKLIYGTLNEDTSDYQLDSVDKIQDFQDWMDDTYGKWAESLKAPGKFYSVKQREQYGYGHMRSQTKKAWEEHQDEYLKEKKLGKYANNATTTTSSDNTVKKDTNVITTSGDNTGKKDTNVITTSGDNTGKKDDNTNSTTSSYEKTQRPSMEVNPFSDNGTFPKDEEGFKKWYNGVYGQELENGTVTIKGNTATVTKDNKSLQFTYNNTVNSWNTTGNIPTKIVIKKKGSQEKTSE